MHQIIEYFKERVDIDEHVFIQRFASKIEIVGDCWLWVGAKSQKGRGVVRYRSGSVSANKVSFMLANNLREMPDSYIKLSCGNISCVNPDHLYLPSIEYADVNEKPTISPHLLLYPKSLILTIRAMWNKTKDIASVSRRFRLSRRDVEDIIDYDWPWLV